MAYTPKATSIIDRCITVLTTAGSTGELTYPFMTYLKHEDFDGIVRFPAVCITCDQEDFSPYKSELQVMATFNFDIVISEPREQFRKDNLRLVAHETRRALTKYAPAELYHTGDIRYGTGVDTKTNETVGRALLRVVMKYKEQR